MSSNLKVNTILPSTGDTVSIAGLASITSSVSIASSCTATTFYGSGANLTGLPAQATIANNADNRVITGGSGVNLNGEANLTFNGQKLNIAAGDGGTDVRFAVRNTNANGYGAYISGGGNNNQYILRLDDKDQNEYFRVSGIGHVGILNGSPQRRLHIGNSGTAESNIRLQGGSDYAEFRVKDSDNALSFHFNVGGAGSRELFNSNGSTGHFSINCYSYQALTITTNENGTNGPEVQLIHNSTSPATSDSIGQLRFSAKDSAGNTDLYARIHANLASPTSGSESGELTFATRGSGTFAERLRITSSGKLQLSNSDGIQLSAQASTLYAVDGTLSFYATNNAVYLNGAGASGWLRLSAAGTANNQTSMNFYGGSYGFGSGGQIDIRTNSTERIRIAPGGLVTFFGTNEQDIIYVTTGGSAGDTFANIRGDNRAGIRIRGGGSYDGGVIELAGGLRSTDPGIIKFSTGTGSSVSERVRITSGGQLYVNTYATDTMFGVKNSGTFELITCRDTSNTLKFYVHHSGATYNSGGSYGSISDVSLKENIVDANSQWDDIKNIKVRNFNFKESTGQETYTQIGVIAQEIETVSPKLVSTPKDDIKTVKYSILYMKSVKALQEAMIRIEALEAEVNALKGS